MLANIYGGFHLFLNNLFLHQSQPNFLFCPWGHYPYGLAGNTTQVRIRRTVKITGFFRFF